MPFDSPLNDNIPLNFNPFSDSFTSHDREVMAILNKNLVTYNGETLTLSEILEGDHDCALDFLKEQVCANKNTNITNIQIQRSQFPSTQRDDYSDWMKKSISAIEGDHNKILSKKSLIYYTRMGLQTAGLIELVIVKKFINSALSMQGKLLTPEEYSSLIESLFNDLIDKIAPSTLEPRTWELILFAFVQIFSIDLSYLTNTLTEFHNARPEIYPFLYYKTIAECVQENSIQTIVERVHENKSGLVNIFLHIPNSYTSQDMKFILILLCIKNIDRHNLIMHTIDECEKFTPNDNDRTNDYNHWIALTRNVLVELQGSDRNFFSIMKQIFNDKELHSSWFPILGNFSKQNIGFFRLFVECKGNLLHEYIKAKQPKLVTDPPFPVIQAMHTVFKHPYYKCTTDFEWYLLDERISLEDLYREIIISILPQESVPNLLKILVARKINKIDKIDHFPLYQELIVRLNLVQYEEIAKNIALLLKFPKKVQIDFIKSWISVSEKSQHPDQQMPSMDQLIQRLGGKNYKDIKFHGFHILNDYLLSAKKLADKKNKALMNSLGGKNKKSKNKSKKKQVTMVIEEPMVLPEVKNEKIEPSIEDVLLEVIEEPSALPEVGVEELEPSIDDVLLEDFKTVTHKKEKSVQKKEGNKNFIASSQKTPQKRVETHNLKNDEFGQKKPTILNQNESKKVEKTKSITPKNAALYSTVVSNQAKPLVLKQSEPPLALKQAEPLALKQAEPPLVLKQAEPLLSKQAEPLVLEQAEPIVLEKAKPQLQYLEQKESKESAIIEESFIPKKDMLFSFNSNLDPNASVWNSPDYLSPPIEIEHPLLSVLTSINQVRLNIYQNKPKIPDLICYKDASQFLFDCSYFGGEYDDPKIPNEIYLYLHCPRGMSSEEMTQWSDILEKNGATKPNRIPGKGPIQLEFFFEDTQIYLTFSKKKLQQVFKIPTIKLNPKQDPKDPTSPVGNFDIPKIFYDAQGNLEKTFSLNPKFPYEKFLCPETWLSIWELTRFLRAAGYSYKKPFCLEINKLEKDILDILDQPYIFQWAVCLFFDKYNISNPDLVIQSIQDEHKIRVLDPYTLGITINGFPPLDNRTFSALMTMAKNDSNRNRKCLSHP